MAPFVRPARAEEATVEIHQFKFEPPEIEIAAGGSVTFTNLDLAMFSDVGHFPHREDPDRASHEIAGFFERIGWR